MFSDRMGLKAKRSQVQLDSMDDALRNGLWDVLSLSYFNDIKVDITGGYLKDNDQLRDLMLDLWHFYFKKPIDTIPQDWNEVYALLRNFILKSAPWPAVYDFIEFVANNASLSGVSESFVRTCNEVLEREASAFRFIEGHITQVISEREINEVQEAQKLDPDLAADHIRRALAYLTDREKKDYAKAVQESLLAIEAAKQPPSRFKEVSALGVALETQAKQILGVKKEPDFHEAKLVVVVSSALVNYSRGKISH